MMEQVLEGAAQTATSFAKNIFTSMTVDAAAAIAEEAAETAARKVLNEVPYAVITKTQSNPGDFIGGMIVGGVVVGFGFIIGTIAVHEAKAQARREMARELDRKYYPNPATV